MVESIVDVDYKEVMEYSLDPLIIHTDYKIIYINKAAEKLFQTTKEEVAGSSPLDIFQETSKGAIQNRILSAYEKPADVIEETVYRMDGTPVPVELYCHPVKMGERRAIQSYIRDITEKKAIEEKHQAVVKEINELSATIVPIMNETAVLPLTGKIDQEKAGQILAVIPEKVQKQKLNHLIIDFSGIYTFDRVVIDSLFKINRVLSLLGVKTIVTGLRPGMAIEAAHMHMDLSEIPAMADVKEALSYLGVHSTQ
ncbi:PAS domain S-box protein [Halobacillus kuroshimensis]|uniref:PAS domain S-box protein n=1 Tax=Halobacillus kuroshimensis TaxID=302481 RepID=UPI000427DF54|nr:PAS domain S-box protein [Halobacillus kuroshimensis]